MKNNSDFKHQLRSFKTTQRSIIETYHKSPSKLLFDESLINKVLCNLNENCLDVEEDGTVMNIADMGDSFTMGGENTEKLGGWDNAMGEGEIGELKLGDLYRQPSKTQ